VETFLRSAQRIRRIQRSGGSPLQLRARRRRRNPLLQPYGQGPKIRDPLEEQEGIRHSEPLRYSDEACVSPAERPVGVELDELGHALVVSSGDVDRTNLPAGNNRKNAASLLLPARVSSK
jgi:hypothetical protein